MSTELEQRLRRIAVQRLESLQRAGVVDLMRTGRLQRRAVANVDLPATDSAGEASLRDSSAAVGPPQETPRQLDTGSAPESRKPAMPRSSRSSSSTDPVRQPGTLFDTETGNVPPRSRAERIAALAALQQRVAACTRCAELAEARNNTVFGVGDPEARLVFLGEAPGAEEDRLGEPFVGRAGQLLTDILKACTLSRDDVYILNILKCRPPGNRNPAPTEAAHCREYLLGQLEVIQPEFICCLGAVATQNLLDTTVAIGRLRGKVHDFRGIKVVATYHPAYLLRNPSAKRATWEDMQMLMREMGIPIPKR